MNLNVNKNYKDNPTEEEKLLLEFYEKRESDKRRIAEQKKILALQLSQPLYKPTRTWTSSRINNPKEDSSIPITESKRVGNGFQSTEKVLLVDQVLQNKSTQETASPLVSSTVENAESECTSASAQSSVLNEVVKVDPTLRSYKKKKKTTDASDVNIEEASNNESNENKNLTSFELDYNVYNKDNLLLTEKWSPHEAIKMDKPATKKFKLKNFGMDDNQTLVLKVYVPPKSKRWSINIGPEFPGAADQHDDPRLSDWTELLLHFNPRSGDKRSGILVNDKQEGIWGAYFMIPLDQLPKIFGVTLDIVIQINARGFLVVIQDQPCLWFEHRREIETKSLYLELPLADDFANAEEVTFHQVWWGHRPAWFVPDDLADRLLFGTSSSLYIQGLPRVTSRESAAELEDMLLELFRSFEAQSVGSPKLARLAVRDMSGYSIEEAEGSQTFILRVDIDR